MSKIVKTEETGVSTDKGKKAGENNPRETTRSTIATIYVCAFLGIVAFSVIIGIFKLSISENRDMLITISGILSGPLGFIIGYYFKTGKD